MSFTKTSKEGPGDADRISDLRALARQFAERELAPRAEALDRGEDGVRQEIWGACAELGLDRALLDEEQGGADLDPESFCLLLEELATGDGGTAVALLLHNAATAALESSPLKEAKLKPKRGERWALVPPSVAGETPLKAHGENGGVLLLEGSLPFALGAGEATGAVVFGHGDDGEIVPAAFKIDSDGVEVMPQPSQMGLRSAAAAELSFNSLRIPAANRTQGGAVDELVWRTRALLWRGVAAVARGIARFAREKAGTYAEERRQGGVPIAEHDAVQLMLADMSARQTSSDLEGHSEPARALAEKIAATEAALETTIDAVQVFGGAGYMVDAGVEKAMRDAKYCQLFPEPNLIGRLQLFKLERR